MFQQKQCPEYRKEYSHKSLMNTEDITTKGFSGFKSNYNYFIMYTPSTHPHTHTNEKQTVSEKDIFL